MAVFGANTKLNSQPPETTGAQGFSTPAAQQNAIVQGIGGSLSSPPSDTKGQSPADKLLAYASNFGTPMPMQNGMQPDAAVAPADNSELAKQLFATPDLTSGPIPSGITPGGPMPMQNGMQADFGAAPIQLDDGYPVVAQAPDGNVPDVGVAPAPDSNTPNGGALQPPNGNVPDEPTWGAPPPSGVGILPGETPPTPPLDQYGYPVKPPPGHPVTIPPGRPRAVAPVSPQAAFTDQQLADHYKTGQPFTPEMQQVIDQRNPKPQGTENPAIAAEWYRGFAFIDPSFASITEADVTNQRMLATSGKFAAMGHPEWNDIGRWVVAGRPGGQYNAPPDQYGYPTTPYSPDPNAMAPDDPRRNVPGPNNYQTIEDQNAKAYAAAQPPVAAPPPSAPPASPAPPAGGTPPGPQQPQGSQPPAAWTPTWGDLGAPPDLPPIPMPDVSNDPWTQMLQKALGAQKDVADAQIRRAVTAGAAAGGGQINMGGFGSAIATPIAEYNANLDKEGAIELSAAHNSAMDRALQGSIAERQSQTQLQLGRMDVMSKKYSADESLEGEKFRAQIDQAIGAAQNASAERISTAVNAKDLQTARIAADSAAQIAASNAASAAAQAGASLAAQKYASDMAYRGTIERISADREQAQLQYNLGITGIGNDTYKANLANQQFTLNLLKDMGPEQLAKYLFGGQQLPSPVFVQP